MPKIFLKNSGYDRFKSHRFLLKCPKTNDNFLEKKSSCCATRLFLPYVCVRRSNWAGLSSPSFFSVMLDNRAVCY